jgi:ABC-type antimicrobial peptide transport system permease subunit
MTYGVRAYSEMNLVVRAADPMAPVPAIVSLVKQLGTGRPVRDIRRLEDSAKDASADIRFALFVIGVLAVLAVILVAVGIYGVVAYAMARRRREIAIRVALGSSRRRLVGLVVGEGAAWTAAGLAAGLAGAAAFTQALRSLLFSVGPYDVLTFSAVAVFLASVALTASAVPALRASRVDPMLALRSE